MKTIALLLAVFCILGLTAVSDPLLRPAQEIALPGVQGRIDHMAVDVKGQRLFVAALGNNTVEIVDLAKGAKVQTLKGLREPQGIAWLPDLQRLVVACGEGASVSIYAGASLDLAATLKTLPDADNVRVDPTGRHVYVGCGEGTEGALIPIDVEAGTQAAGIPLSGHPESFQLEKVGQRIFVNVPDSDNIAVVDRAQGKVVAAWPLPDARANFPMALDEKDARLFVGCRKPAVLLVLDTATGKPVVRLDCVGDADDVFYDADRRRVYVIGGEGRIDVFEQTGPDQYRLAEKVPTAPGARTALFVPETQTLYVAVPKTNDRPAQIRTYTLTPP